MRRFQVVAMLCSLFLLSGDGLLQAQQPPPPPPPNQALTPQQLGDLVAPIALYPDPLLSQILVAATYPLEVVQAYQWMQRNPGLTGSALTAAAQEQNWDPSVQALVVFPDVVKRLNDDVTWTTNLGNAFLAQQSEVMDAVQRLRQQAQQAGKLNSTPQEVVSTVSDQGGAPAIEIEPADPAVIYVPVYDPMWIWGPPLYYPYPRWYWPPRPGAGIFFNFGPGISIGAFFGGGWGGWGGWGWHPGWGGHTVIVNNTFIHRYNFNAGHLAQLHGTTVWQHDAFHRQGVPYARPEVANRFQGSVRENLRPNATSQARTNPGQAPQANERMGNRTVPQNNPKSGGVFGGMENGQAAKIHSDHGYSSLGPSRSGGGAAPHSAPAQAPRGNPGGGHRGK
jgi:hypothetical protein